MVDVQLRQLRRVRWALRGTLALGIAASLAANVLHARHVLIDQLIAGWPPVAVFATIEAIARVPARRRWLAVIRMAGLAFVAGIAFWVSYWHMAAVAAAHGETDSRFLLPLSVDGLVVVSSISLVELTGQIIAATAPPTTTTVTATTVTDTTVTDTTVTDATVTDVRRQSIVGTPTPGERGHSRTRPRTDRGTPQRTGPSHAGREVEPLVVDAGQTPVTPSAAAGSGTGDTPPADPAGAVTWWRAKDPTMSARRIAATVGLSDRTVRRILNTTLTPAGIGEAAARPAGAE